MKTRFGIKVSNTGFSSVSRIIRACFESGIYNLFKQVQLKKSQLAQRLSREFIEGMQRPERVQMVTLSETFVNVFLLMTFLVICGGFVQIGTIMFFYRIAITKRARKMIYEIVRIYKVVINKIYSYIMHSTCE